MPVELFPLLGVLQTGFFLVLFLIASIIDYRHRVIPDSICALIAVAGLFSFNPVHLLGPLAALPFLIASISKPGSMGGGDIKFTAASGLVLGFWCTLWGIALGLALAVLFHYAKSLLWRLRSKKHIPIHQAALPLAPFLSAGFAAFYFIKIGGLL